MFWFLRGHLREGYGWLTQALAVESDATPADRVQALWAAGMLAWSQGDFRRGGSLGAQARELAGEHGLVFGMATALYLLFLATEMEGRCDEATALGEESVARMRESGARPWLAYVLADVGTRLVKDGDLERGEAWIEEGLALHQEFGNKQGFGNKLCDLGLVRHEAGDTRAAARHYAESLRWLWEGGDVWYLASALEGLAAVALDAGQASEAAQLLGAAAALRERSGGAVWPDERARLAHSVTAARAALGDEVYAREAAAGRALSLPEVVAQAIAMAAAFPSTVIAGTGALAGRRLRSVAPRARGAPHARPGEIQPRDRRGAVHRPRHRPHPRLQHPGQARRQHAHRSRDDRSRSRAPVSRAPLHLCQVAEAPSAASSRNLPPHFCPMSDVPARPRRHHRRVPIDPITRPGTRETMKGCDGW